MKYIKLTVVLLLLYCSACSKLLQNIEHKPLSGKHMQSTDPAFEIINRINNVVERAERKEELVTNFMQSYFDKIFAIEVQIADEMAKTTRDKEKMDELLSDKREVFKSFWLLDDEQRVKFYYPSSWSGTPHHDWTKVKNIKLYETGDDIKPQFLFSYTYNEKPFGDTPYTYAIKYENNKLLITDYYFEL